MINASKTKTTKDLIPDLEWKQCNSGEFITKRVVDKKPVISGLIDSSFNVFLDTQFGSFVVKDGRFNNADEAKTWANEQYKNKVMEVLGV